MDLYQQYPNRFQRKKLCGEIREKQSEFIVFVSFLLLGDLMFAAWPGHCAEQGHVVFVSFLLLDDIIFAA